MKATTQCHRIGLALCAVPLVLGTLAAPRPAFGHAERAIESFPREGSVPDENRVQPNEIVVCKNASRTPLPTIANLARSAAPMPHMAVARQHAVRLCAYQNIQDAIDAAGDDTAILVLPGIYREEPSRARPTSERGDNPDGSYSYEYHVAHPNDANLVAILGKKNITLQGLGDRPSDVVIDAGFVKDVVVRADRADGFVVKNLTAINAREHGIYVVETSGYVFSHAIGAYSREYELFSFASDHGVFHDSEAIGGGDSGFYVGGAPSTAHLGRFSTEMYALKMHHNSLGFSGTQGSSIWMHDNDVYDNAIGLSFDSENDHPDFPQRNSLIENNDIHDNNFDIYAPTSDVPPRGPALDFFHYPIGTGMWIIGGLSNVVRNNRVYNHRSFGFILAGNALEMPLPAIVEGNQFVDNLFGPAAQPGARRNGYDFPPGGAVYTPGGTDYFWDGTGDDNCWTVSSTDTSFPDPLPGPCPFPNTGLAAPEGEQLDLLLACLIGDSGKTEGDCPFGTTNRAPGYNRNEWRILLNGGTVRKASGGGY